jgi:hypothetical protein
MAETICGYCKNKFLSVLTEGMGHNVGYRHRHGCRKVPITLSYVQGETWMSRSAFPTGSAPTYPVEQNELLVFSGNVRRRVPGGEFRVRFLKVEQCLLNFVYDISVKEEKLLQTLWSLSKPE